MKNIILLSTVILSFLSLNSAFAGIQFENLDYSKRIDSEKNNLVFVPYKNSNLGNIFFNSYKIVHSPPRGLGDVRNIYIDILKAVPIDDLQKFRNQLYNLGYKSEEKTPLPAEAICQLTENVKDFFSKYQLEEFMPSIVFKDDIALCSTKFTFLVEDEQEVLKLVSENPIKIIKDVPLCSKDSPKIKFWESDLMKQLIQEKVISETPDHQWKASAWELLYSSVKLSLDLPDLFGDGEPKESWKLFRDKFIWDFANDTASLDISRTDLVHYECVSEPLVIQIK